MHQIDGSRSMKVNFNLRPIEAQAPEVKLGPHQSCDLIRVAFRLSTLLVLVAEMMDDFACSV